MVKYIIKSFIFFIQFLIYYTH